MEADFWHQCWDKDHIGFHQDNLHPLLREFFPSWRGSHGGRIFVPLCGKSLDMHYLAGHNRVFGCELSEKACEDFFTEAELDCHLVKDHRYTRFIGSDIELCAGDFFALVPQDVADCPLIYDRAALIALPKQMRQGYIEHLRALYPQGGKLFLLTLEYPKGELEGPPFAVDEDEVLQLFQGCCVERVKTLDLPGGKFARRTFKVSWMREALYFIKW